MMINCQILSYTGPPREILPGGTRLDLGLQGQVKTSLKIEDFSWKYPPPKKKRKEKNKTKQNTKGKQKKNST